MLSYRTANLATFFIVTFDTVLERALSTYFDTARVPDALVSCPWTLVALAGMTNSMSPLTRQSTTYGMM
jgi:hypothetical protein